MKARPFKCSLNEAILASNMINVVEFDPEGKEHVYVGVGWSLGRGVATLSLTGDGENNVDFLAQEVWVNHNGVAKAVSDKAQEFRLVFRIQRALTRKDVK